jgi:hypothetical protein
VTDAEALLLVWKYVNGSIPRVSQQSADMIALVAPPYNQTMGSALMMLTGYANRPASIQCIAQLIDHINRVNGPTNDLFHWVEKTLINLTSHVTDEIGVEFWPDGVSKIAFPDTNHYKWQLVQSEQQAGHGEWMQHCLRNPDVVWNKIATVYSLVNTNGVAVRTAACSLNGHGLFVVAGKQSSQQSTLARVQALCELLNTNPSLLLTLSDPILHNQGIVYADEHWQRLSTLGLKQIISGSLNCNNYHQAINLRPSLVIQGNAFWCNTRATPQCIVEGDVITHPSQLHSKVCELYGESIMA